MKQLASLAWKEWREASPYLWIGLGVFLGLPLIGFVEAMIQHMPHLEIETLPWVLIFGGVMAVFVGVGVTCRDFSGGLENFWRSRPITVERWLLVKYLVGLAIVLAADLLPLIVEGLYDPYNTDIGALPLWLPFLWIAIYSLGFVAGCLLRRTAHAATVALAAMLLLYCLPLVLPPLAWLQMPTNNGNIPYFDQSTGQYGIERVMRRFNAGMLIIALAALFLALVAVRRKWRIDAGRKLIYGAVATTFLILIGSAGYQLGTNLPVLQQIDLPRGEVFMYLRWVHDSGYVVTSRANYNASRPIYHSLHLTASGMELGGGVDLPPDDHYWGYSAAFDPQNPDIEYYADQTDDFGSAYIDVYVSQLDKGINVKIQQIPEQDMNEWPTIYAWRNRLYVIGRRLIIFDITQPRDPRLISNEPFHFFFFVNGLFNGLFESGKLTFALPPIPDLPPRERLGAALNQGSYFNASEGDILCLNRGPAMEAYHLTKLTEDEAVFEPIGEYEPTILERVFGFSRLFRSEMKNGLVYVSQGHGTILGYDYKAIVTSNGRITVLDTAGPNPMRVVGHFAAPSADMAVPLPDGRAIIGGGGKLWLVGPPPNHGE